MHIDAKRFEAFGYWLRQFTVICRQDAVCCFYDAYLCADFCKRRPHFQADITRTDNGNMLRNLLQVERFCGRNHISAKRKKRQFHR